MELLSLLVRGRLFGSSSSTLHNTEIVGTDYANLTLFKTF